VIHNVLVIEDHDQWRHYLASTVRRTPGWRVVGEASDGAEGVQKASDLNPDVILMDVGLPTLNGMQAVQRILAQHPESRILFVSEQRSWDIAEAALATGALGYVIKSDVHQELLQAMSAIAHGRRFVSARLAGRTIGPADDGGAVDETRRHEVGFYEDDAARLDEYAVFAEAALLGGSSLIFVMSPGPRRDEFHQRLWARGIDVDRAINDRRYRPFDVPAILSRFMVDGMPDEAEFWRSSTSLILEVASLSTGDRPRIAACGECAAGLLDDGKVEAAIRLEELWDEVTRTYNVDTFCAYSSHAAGCDHASPVFHRICAAHSTVRQLG
jgi:CheY-like chemotaxis protein